MMNDNCITKLPNPINLKGKVNGIYEFSEDSFQQEGEQIFYTCISNDGLPWLVFGCPNNQNNIELSKF